MKKKIFLVLFSIGAGIIFTFFFLNKENIYAKEEYSVYVLQAGAFETIDNANQLKNNLANNISSIVIKENNLYKVYVAITKNLDIVNNMLAFYQKNNLNIYLKTIKVDKEFYNNLDGYEKILINSNDESIYNKINENILKLYLKGISNESN